MAMTEELGLWVSLQAPELTALQHNGAWLEGLHNFLHDGLEERVKGVVGCPVLQGNVDGIVLAWDICAGGPVNAILRF